MTFVLIEVELKALALLTPTLGSAITVIARKLKRMKMQPA